MSAILTAPVMNEKIWIAEVVNSSMQELADSYFPLETGGMLLGYIGENGEAVVTSMIGPGPNAFHGRFKFIPDGKYQQAELERAFLESEGRVTYLGDWHTHPKGSASPSYFDKRTLAKIAAEPASGISKPIMAILGRGDPTWDMGVIRFYSMSGFIISNYKVTSLSTTVF